MVWLVTVCDMALVVVAALVVFALLRKLSPGHDVLGEELWRYCLFSVVCQLVLTIFLPCAEISHSMRVDEIMQACFRSGVLLFLLTCAALTFTSSLTVAHTFLALSAAFFSSLLFIWRLVQRYFMRLAKNKEKGSTLPSSELPSQLEAGGWLKRLIDICVSLALLLTLYPVIYTVMFVVTKLRRRGPVYSVYKAGGTKDREFGCLMFRCMRGPMRKLPMLINVLAGHVSLVGSLPRSPQCAIKYRDMAREQGAHRIVKPGMASLAWVRRVDEEEMKESLVCDLWYANHWTFWLDVCIVLKTIFRIRDMRKHIVQDNKPTRNDDVDIQ